MCGIETSLSQFNKLKDKIMEETKIIYYVDSDPTPFLIKVPVPVDHVTLGDFKKALHRQGAYSYSFKTMDSEYGLVKEPIHDDSRLLPNYDGRVVAWLDSKEGSVHSDATSQTTDDGAATFKSGSSRGARSKHSDGKSIGSNVTKHTICENGGGSEKEYSKNGDHGDSRRGIASVYDGQTTTDGESTVFETDDDSRSSAVTDTYSCLSKMYYRRVYHGKGRPLSPASSLTSIAERQMETIEVVLDLNQVGFLGISILGDQDERSGGAIFVGNIVANGAVHLDGRIAPGDMILQVNDISLEGMSNATAVQILRDATFHPGLIRLIVAKRISIDSSNSTYFSPPSQSEAIRPIDPSAWVAQQAARSDIMGTHGVSASALRAIDSSQPGNVIGETVNYSGNRAKSSSYNCSDKLFSLTCDMDMSAVVRAMKYPNDGVTVKDRQWLKITIPKAFIGSELVDWLLTNVEGFKDKRDAKKYADRLLKEGFIRHVMDKKVFYEQCYYTFAEDTVDLSSLSVQDDITENDSVSQVAAREGTLRRSNVSGESWPPHGAQQAFRFSQHNNNDSSYPKQTMSTSTFGSHVYQTADSTSYEFSNNEHHRSALNVRYL